MGDHDVTLAECVGLLSSESRERKFMGMVLVTKLVHGLDPESLRAVSEARDPSWLRGLAKIGLVAGKRAVGGAATSIG